MPTPTNAELLRKAATVLKKRGHAKYRLQDDRGHVCLLGAINVAIAGDAYAYPDRAERLLDRVAKYLGLKSGFEAVDWNNASRRKIGEVIGALRGAARQAAR